MSKKFLVPLFAVLLLSACAGTPRFADMPIGQATRADIYGKHGAPTRSWKTDDGSEVLEYSSQPTGNSGTYLLTLTPDGKLRQIQQTLTAEGRARIRPGMSKDQVSKWLGKERAVRKIEESGEEVWDWQLYLQPDGRGTLFQVYFKDDRVVRTGISDSFPDEHCKMANKCIHED